MSSKDQKPSKKAQKEKQKKAIEDSTFGLKNKNKSKKVQQFVSRVEKSVKHSGNGLELEKARELKKEAKLAKMIQEEELRQLMNEAIGSQFGVKKSKAQANANQLGLTAVKKEVTEFLEALSDDSESDSSDSEDEVQVFDDEAASNEPQFVEVFREKTIEDIIEEQRAKLAAEGKKGTPVTEESFAKWRAEKLAKRQADAEARLKNEQTKKKGGKGLSVLSGKELFNYNASLFVDDESAFDTSNDKAINAEMKALQEKEEQQIKEEYERAQAEQMRLFEIQKAEMEARRYREEDRRKKACAPNRITFVFNGIIINQIVFEEDDDEDLELFADEPFLPNTEQHMTENQENEMSNLMNELNIHDQKVRRQRHEKDLEQEDDAEEGEDGEGEDDGEGGGEDENSEQENDEGDGTKLKLLPCPE